MTSKAAVRQGIVWIVVLVVVAAAVWFALRGGAVPVRTGNATTGPITSYVEDRGRTSLPDGARFVVSMPVDGRVLSVGPDVGQPVQTGQPLVEIDTEPLSLAVGEAKAAVAGNEVALDINAYDKLEKTALREANDLTRSMSSVVDASQKRVEASRVQHDFADWWKQRVEKLTAESAAGDLELQKAKTDYAAAAVDLSYQQFLLAAVRVVDEIVNLYPQAVADFIELKGIYRGSIEQELAASKAQLAAAELKLSDATERVKSPIDGVVLERYVTHERVLPAGTPLIEVGDLSRLRGEVDLLTQEAANVTPGDKAEVFGLMPGAVPVAATVTRVDPAGFTKLSSLGVEEQRVTVTVEFNADALAALRDSARLIGAGYRVRIRIHTAEVDDAVRVPRSALFRGDDGGWRVFAVEGGRARLTPVTVGLLNDTQVQIIEGVDGSASVVLAPGADLRDGARVRPDRAGTGNGG